MDKISVVILGGGRGSRLFPLTHERAKPAVSFAGKYRLIDIPISNCIYSGINRISVLTKYLSASLHRYIMHTYKFDTFNEGFIDFLAAEPTLHGTDWFHGTADAGLPPAFVLGATRLPNTLMAPPGYKDRGGVGVVDAWIPGTVGRLRLEYWKSLRRIGLEVGLELSMGIFTRPLEGQWLIAAPMAVGAGVGASL